VTEQHTTSTDEAQALWAHIFGADRGFLQIFTGVRENPEDTELKQSTLKWIFVNYPDAAHDAAE